MRRYEKTAGKHRIMPQRTRKPGQAVPSAAALDAVTTVERVALLTFDAVSAWFAERAAATQQERDTVLVSIAEDFRSGHVSLVQGTFDMLTGLFREARRIEAAEADQRMRSAHTHNEVVVWRPAPQAAAGGSTRGDPHGGET
jgi:acetyl esterase/lipase